MSLTFRDGRQSQDLPEYRRVSPKPVFARDEMGRGCPAWHRSFMRFSQKSSFIAPTAIPEGTLAEKVCLPQTNDYAPAQPPGVDFAFSQLASQVVQSPNEQAKEARLTFRDRDDRGPGPVRHQRRACVLHCGPNRDG